jgi:pre-60S factor REI1
MSVRSAEPDQSRNNVAAPSSSRQRRDDVEYDHVEDDEEDSQEDDVDYESDSDEDDLAVPDFDPGECLFCTRIHDPSSLESNMAHMASAHGFSIPFQDFLAADRQTVLRFLHFVIQAYRECICCSTRRATVEGVRQHMLAKGHCRFDVGPDTEEFYEMPQEEGKGRNDAQVMMEGAHQDASILVRLPSGKIISHRRAVEVQEPKATRRPCDKPDRRTRLESYGQPNESPSSSSNSRSGGSGRPGGTSMQVAEQRGRGGNDVNGSGQVTCSRSEALLAAQMSRLMVASNREQIKLEQRQRFRVDRKNNLTLSKHFKVDAGDSRAGRNFCC